MQKQMRSIHPSLLGLLLAALLGGNASAIPANPASDPNASKTLSPYFIVLAEGAAEQGGVELMPLKSTRVNATISGVIADVEVRQTYHNTGSSVLEAVYVFPGSTRAAVHGMTMRIGDRLIDAKVEERQKAKAIYEEAKANNQSASLLEQQRPNVFQMNVANILPGDLIEVTLRYTEYLAPTDKVYEFVYPTVVGPRYSNTPEGTPAAADAWVSNPYLEEGVEDPTSFDIRVNVQAGMPIQSLACGTHPVQINYSGPETASVLLDGSELNAGNRDYILRYRLADEQITSGLLLQQDKSLGENFFLLTVQPPVRVKPEHVPPREYVFVVDVSGSMNGFPLNTAKTLMRELIADLNPDDAFNILIFAGGSELMAQRSLPATPANLKRAELWLDRLQAGGGTELVKALTRAVQLSRDESISRSIVVVTDGYVSFERDAFQVVRENLGQANLFAFGIGSSVNRFLIEGLARAGRGEPFVVTEPAHAAAEARRLKAYISAPVLTNVRVDFGRMEVYDVEPASIPDVLADRPITIFGKYRGKPSGSIRLSGVSGENRFEKRVDLGSATTGNPALPYLWARHRVANLSDDHQIGADEDSRLQIVNLGLTYNLLTEFTSFVAVDDVVRDLPENAAKQTVKQPLPLPKGVPSSAIGGGTVPEPGLIHLVLLALAGFWWHTRRLRPRRG